MNKLTKDQIQKIVLSGIFMIFLIYCFCVYLIAPIDSADAKYRAAIAKLDTDLSTANSRIKRLQAMEEQGRASSEVMAQVTALIPEGEPIAWFPPRIRAFFDRQGIKDSIVRLDHKDKMAEPELASFDYFNWTIDLPSVSYVPLGIALAGLENEDPLLEINRVQISIVADHPEEQRITLAVGTILR